MNYMVNPMIRHDFKIIGLAGDSRVQIRVKDFGVLSSNTVLNLGPRVIAQTSLPVGKNIEGFIELDPCKDISDNGVPVMQVSIRFHGGPLASAPALSELADAAPDPHQAVAEPSGAGSRVPAFPAAGGGVPAPPVAGDGSGVLAAGVPEFQGRRLRRRHARRRSRPRRVPGFRGRRLRRGRRRPATSL